jgi:hypothetical protein
MEPPISWSETEKRRWELVVARVGVELGVLIDENIDSAAKEEAVGAVFDLYCSIMARAQQLEALAEIWSAGDPNRKHRLDAVRLVFPLPIPSWDEWRSDTTP